MRHGRLWAVALLAICQSATFAEESSEDQPSWYEVYATREGLIGHTTASGHKITKDSVFVALPDTEALGRTVAVRYKDKTIRCKVKDVGPWSTQDPYWRLDRHPLAESGRRKPSDLGPPPTNPGAIDLSNALWDKLGIERGIGYTRVQWRFVDDKEDG